jgi:hypothetical protein
MSCANIKCGRDVTGSKDVIKCVSCNNLYHVTCCRVRNIAKLTAMSKKSIEEWCCDNCSAEVSHKNNQPEIQNPHVMEMLKGITTEIRESRDASQKSFATLEMAMFAVQTTLEAMQLRIVKIEEENKNITMECGILKAENGELKKRVANIELELLDAQQYSRNQNIEISGIPVTTEEDTYAILESVSKALDVQYDRGDVSIAHRLPLRRVSGRDVTGRQRQHPTIVAQFVSRSTRARWLDAARKRRIQAKDVSPVLPEGPVFISEHLTQHNKIVLGRAKFLVKQKKLAYAWAREGKVFVRKTIDGRALRVRYLEDVDREARIEDVTRGVSG